MAMMDLKLQANFPRELKVTAETFPRAAAAALNHVARSARTEVSKEIRQTYNIKASDIKDVMYVTPASRNNLVAKLSLGGGSLALMLFGARQTAQGVSVAVKRGVRKIVKQPKWASGKTFIAQMNSGHEGIFARTGEFGIMKSGSYKGQRRERIKELFTIGLAQMFPSRKIRQALTDFVTDKLPDELERTIEAFRKLGRE